MATPEEEISKAKAEYEKAKAQAKARYEKTTARHKTAARKYDTRRKVILGGALIELAERDTQARTMMEGIIQRLSRDQDKKAFEGWEKPSASNTDNQDGRSPYV